MDSNKYLSRSFDSKRTSHDPSTVFEATIAQAEIAMKNQRPKQFPMNLSRKPISQRSSNTFKSEVFKPPARQIVRFGMERLMDHGPKDFYEQGQVDFYRKSKVSDFQPNFEPRYLYQPGWGVENESFLQVSRNISSEKALSKSFRQDNKENEVDLKTGKNSEKQSRVLEKPQPRILTETSQILTSPKAVSPLVHTPDLVPKLSQIDALSKPQEFFRSATPQTTSRLNLQTNICLDLSGLTALHSEYALRRLCKDLQIVNLTAPRNNITGKNTGKASLTLKGSDKNISLLKSELSKKGITFECRFLTGGKKNNYRDLSGIGFLDQHVNKESQKSPSKYHLETSHDLFGSSPGVGRCHTGRRIRDKQAEVLVTWNKIKFAKHDLKKCEELTSVPSYMRSTESSAKKCKKA